MFKSTISTLEQLSQVLRMMPDHTYSKATSALSGGTIGQHTRHAIELFQCLMKGYHTGDVCYDRRDRDKRMETNSSFALEHLNLIIQHLRRENKSIQIIYLLEDSEVKIESNYFREVMYNLEHTIHHAALIKVALLEHTQMNLPIEFGVAPSTTQYRMQCAQ